MALRIDNLDAFEAWLNNQPKEVACVMAHRTAARMWPIIALDVVHEEFHSTWRANASRLSIRRAMIYPFPPGAGLGAKQRVANAARSVLNAMASSQKGEWPEL